VISAYVFQELESRVLLPKDRKRFGPGLLLAAAAGFADLLALGVYATNRAVPLEFVWGAAALTVFSILFISRQSNRLPTRLWQVLILPALILDAGGVAMGQIEFHPAGEIFKEGAISAGWLKNQEGLFRIYTPSYSIPQSTAALYRLEQVNGIDPLQIKAYADYMKTATGTSSEGYSVTIPAFSQEDLSHANQSAKIDINRLALLNVRYVVSEFPILDPGLVQRFSDGATRIYEILSAHPRAWVQAGLDPAGKSYQVVSSIEVTPNQIDITANGIGWLVLSEINYPGWRVYMDGKESKIVTVDGIFRGVFLSDGPHQIVFRFFPVSLVIGICLALTGWLILLVFSVLASRKPVHGHS
jgi:hypothetical protein